MPPKLGAFSLKMNPENKIRGHLYIPRCLFFPVQCWTLAIERKCINCSIGCLMKLGAHFLKANGGVGEHSCFSAIRVCIHFGPHLPVPLLPIKRVQESCHRAERTGILQVTSSSPYNLLLGCDLLLSMYHFISEWTWE